MIGFPAPTGLHDRPGYTTRAYFLSLLADYDVVVEAKHIGLSITLFRSVSYNI